MGLSLIWLRAICAASEPTKQLASSLHDLFDAYVWMELQISYGLRNEAKKIGKDKRPRYMK